jgi:hypothetical protein
MTKYLNTAEMNKIWFIYTSKLYVQEIAISVFLDNKWFKIDEKFNYLFEMSKRSRDIKRIASYRFVHKQSFILKILKVQHREF